MLVETKTVQGRTVRIIFSAERTADIHVALLLTYITLAWMTIEGAAELSRVPS